LLRFYSADGETPSTVFKGKKIAKYALHGFQGTIQDLSGWSFSGRRTYVKVSLTV